MASLLIERVRGQLLGRGHRYALLNQQRNGTLPVDSTSRRKRVALLAILAAVAIVVGLLVSGVFTWPRGHLNALGCDTEYEGYKCEPEISHHWGQYSPYFAVPSNVSDALPDHCNITFAQILSRHGARDPTASKTHSYNKTIHKVQANVRKFSGIYSFLSSYQYTLGADQLTPFGKQQMIYSGIKYYERYRALSGHLTPFVRSSGQDRVVGSAKFFSQGFHAAKLADRSTDDADSTYPYPIVVISEANYGVNNTLNHDLCTSFENGTYRDVGGEAQAIWAAYFTDPIRTRLNAALKGADLSHSETIDMMDLCPFNTVASPTGIVSPFCALFTEAEWHRYDYYQTLGKYYGFSHGNPLGPTQGVGFANELIARLTDTAVEDETSTNHTLDSSDVTFPLHRQLYADFSHDNDMTTIFSALGLYNDSSPLPKSTIMEASQANGYSAAWTVPFAARAYFEKMQCDGEAQEFVRVIVNDRVLPLSQCGGDSLGRCTLGAFVDSLGLGFAVLNALLRQDFIVEVFERKSSKSTSNYPQGVFVTTISDDFPVSELSAALSGQHAVIVTIKGSEIEVQKRRAEACVEAGVQRFIPADFGSCDSSSALTQQLMPLYNRKTELREYLTKLAEKHKSRFSWTAIVCGIFFDWKLALIHIFLSDHRADVLDGGGKKFSIGTVSGVGEAVARVLQMPDETRNRTLYVQSFCVSQLEVVWAFERATAVKWEITDYAPEEWKSYRKAKAEEGDNDAVEEPVWYLGTMEADWRTREGFVMQLLGLQDEDLDAVVLRVVQQSLPSK